LVLTGGADVVLRGDSTSERQSLVECKLKTMGAKIGASHSPLGIVSGLDWFPTLVAAAGACSPC
jgi:hypothetical protein